MLKDDPLERKPSGGFGYVAEAAQVDTDQADRPAGASPSLGSDDGASTPRAGAGAPLLGALLDGFAGAFDGDGESIASTGTGWGRYAETGSVRFSWRKLWAYTGPGFLMSIAYLDPGNLEADLQVGAKGKYQLLWVLLLATTMGFMLQTLSAKIGVVTGKHLAAHCRAFPPLVRYTLWGMTEIALICADCQEVIGSALAMNILSAGYVPVWAGCLVTAADCFLFMLLDRRGVRYLEALFALLIAVMVGAFGAEYVAALPPQAEVLRGVFLPRMESSENFHSAVGLIGAVIMPHNLFLHSALVLSRKVDRRAPDPERARYRVKEALFYFNLEACMALVLTFCVNLFVVSVFAHLKYAGAGGEPICAYQGVAVMNDEAACAAATSAPHSPYAGCAQIGLETAGECLSQAYGARWWVYVWAVGLLAAGQASTVTGTYAGQFIMEGFLELRIGPALRVAVSRSASLVPALFVAVTTVGSPGNMDALNAMLNIAQSIQLPFAVLPALYFASNTKTVGRFATCGTPLVLVWCIAGAVLGANAYAVYLFLADLTVSPLGHTALLAAGSVYVSLIAYLAGAAAGIIRPAGTPPTRLPSSLRLPAEGEAGALFARGQAGGLYGAV